MAADEINCWEDAGSWEDIPDFIPGSIRLRLEAIRKAVLERCLLCGIPCEGIGKSFPFPGSISAAVAVLTPYLEILPTYFPDIRDGLIRRLEVTGPDGDKQIFTQVPLEDFTHSQQLDYGTFQFRIDHGFISLNVTEECYLLHFNTNQLGKVSLSPFEKSTLPQLYPVTAPVGDTFSSLIPWLQNAYRILKHLIYPVRGMKLWLEDVVAEKSRAHYRAFEIYSSETAGYAVFPGTQASDPSSLYYYDDEPSEQTAWDLKDWVTVDEDSSFAYRRTEEFTGTEAGFTPFGYGVPYQRLRVERQYAETKGYNGSTLNYLNTEEPASVTLEYKKQLRAWIKGDSFLEEDYPADTWLDIHTGELEGDADFDSAGEVFTGIPAGNDGSSYDGWRKREVTLSADLSGPRGMTFL